MDILNNQPPSSVLLPESSKELFEMFDVLQEGAERGVNRVFSNGNGNIDFLVDVSGENVLPRDPHNLVHLRYTRSDDGNGFRQVIMMSRRYLWSPESMFMRGELSVNKTYILNDMKWSVNSQGTLAFGESIVPQTLFPEINASGNLKLSYYGSSNLISLVYGVEQGNDVVQGFNVNSQQYNLGINYFKIYLKEIIEKLKNLYS